MPNRKLMDVIRNKPLLIGFLDTTAYEAAKQMKEKGVGSMIVMANSQLTGIFTERDLMNRVVAEGLDPTSTCLGNVMTRSVVSIECDKPFTHALHLMHINSCRHIPVLLRGMPIGMVTARDALGMEWQQFEREISEAEHLFEILA